MLGTGLMGASVGMALRRTGWLVTGWDPDVEALSAAASHAAFDVTAGDRDQAIDDADLVVLAAPVEAVITTVSEIPTEALVTDVAGVKTPVVGAVREGLRFVGGHPMAGRESSGPANASAAMFKGATWALTKDGCDWADLERMEAIVAAFGAIPLVMTAAEHDAAVALASHLPQILASTLVEMVAQDHSASALAAGGFRDLTRIALSESSWWSEVLVANKGTVAAALRAMAEHLQGWADSVISADKGKIESKLAEAREGRKAMVPAAATIPVVLEDRPGEIARVGHALAASGVDLRDLQLRHGTHGGGGILTLTVRDEEEEILRAALLAEGFRLGG